MSQNSHSIQVKVEADLKVLSSLRVQTEAQLEAVKKLRDGYDAQAKALAATDAAQATLKAGIDAANAALNSQSAQLVQTSSALRQHAAAMRALNTPESAAAADRARDQIAAIQNALGQAQGPMQRVKESLVEFHEAFKNAGGGINGAAAALNAGLGSWVAWGYAAKKAVDFGREAVAEFEHLEQAIFRMNAVLASNGALEASENYKKLAESLSYGGVGGERWMGVLTKLTQHGAPTAEIEKYGEAVKNLAAIMQTSPERAAMFLTRAMDGNTRSLRRWGIDVAQTGDKAAEFAEVLAQINEKGAAVAEAMGNTMAGATNRLNVQISNIKETVGEFVSGLLRLRQAKESSAKMAEWFAHHLSSLREAMEKLPEPLRDMLGLTDKYKQANKESAIEVAEAKRIEEERTKALKDAKEATDEAARATSRYVNELNGQIAAQMELIDAETKLKMATVDADLKSGKINAPEAERRKQAIRADADNKKFQLKDQEQQNKIVEADQKAKSAREDLALHVKEREDTGRRVNVTQQIKAIREAGGTVSEEQAMNMAAGVGLAYDPSLLDVKAYERAKAAYSAGTEGDKHGRETKRKTQEAEKAEDAARDARRKLATMRQARSYTAAADTLTDQTNLTQSESVFKPEEQARAAKLKAAQIDAEIRRGVTPERFKELQRQKAALQHEETAAKQAAEVERARPGGSPAALAAAQLALQQTQLDITQNQRDRGLPVALPATPTRTQAAVVGHIGPTVPGLTPTPVGGVAGPLTFPTLRGLSTAVPGGTPTVVTGGGLPTAVTGGGFPIPLPVIVVGVQSGVSIPFTAGGGGVPTVVTGGPSPSPSPAPVVGGVPSFVPPSPSSPSSPTLPGSPPGSPSDGAKGRIKAADELVKEAVAKESAATAEKTKAAGEAAEAKREEDRASYDASVGGMTVGGISGGKWLAGMLGKGASAIKGQAVDLLSKVVPMQPSAATLAAQKAAAYGGGNFAVMMNPGAFAPPAKAAIPAIAQKTASAAGGLLKGALSKGPHPLAMLLDAGFNSSTYNEEGVGGVGFDALNAFNVAGMGGAKALPWYTQGGGVEFKNIQKNFGLDKGWFQSSMNAIGTVARGGGRVISAGAGILGAGYDIAKESAKSDELDAANRRVTLNRQFAEALNSGSAESLLSGDRRQEMVESLQSGGYRNYQGKWVRESSVVKAESAKASAIAKEAAPDEVGMPSAEDMARIDAHEAAKAGKSPEWQEAADRGAMIIGERNAAYNAAYAKMSPGQKEMADKRAGLEEKSRAAQAERQKLKDSITADKLAANRPDDVRARVADFWANQNATASADDVGSEGASGDTGEGDSAGLDDAVESIDESSGEVADAVGALAGAVTSGHQAVVGALELAMAEINTNRRQIDELRAQLLNNR